jgi:hypothetical protein
LEEANKLRKSERIASKKILIKKDTDLTEESEDEEEETNSNGLRKINMQRSLSNELKFSSKPSSNESKNRM